MAAAEAERKSDTVETAYALCLKTPRTFVCQISRHSVYNCQT